MSQGVYLVDRSFIHVTDHRQDALLNLKVNLDFTTLA